MSGLLFLTVDDFLISRGTKGNILCNTIGGFSLILFYSTQCQHCQNFIPIFKKLPGTVGGCQFGMVNVGANKGLIRMSKETITPLTFVPYIVLYINTRPFMAYRGNADINEIRRFVIEVSQKINNKQKFSEEKVQEQARGSVPPYTIGHALYGDEEDFYKEFIVAYPSLNDKKPQGIGGQEQGLQQLQSQGNLYGQNDARSMQFNNVQRSMQRR
jgi:hypothetical protein